MVYITSKIALLKQVLLATNRDVIIRCSNVALIGINPGTNGILNDDIYLQVSNANQSMMTNDSRKGIVIVIVAILIIVMCSCGIKVY